MKGFTLIETIIAIFILSVGIISILGMFFLGSKIEKSAQMAAVATQLAQSKMEETISMPYDEISLGTTTEDYDSIDSFSSFKRVKEVSCYDPNGAISPNCPDTGIKDVKISVFWKSLFRFSDTNINVKSLIAKR